MPAAYSLYCKLSWTTKKKACFFLVIHEASNKKILEYRTITQCRIVLVFLMERTISKLCQRLNEVISQSSPVRKYCKVFSEIRDSDTVLDSRISIPDFRKTVQYVLSYWTKTLTRYLYTVQYSTTLTRVYTQTQ